MKCGRLLYHDPIEAGFFPLYINTVDIYCLLGSYIIPHTTYHLVYHTTSMHLTTTLSRSHFPTKTSALGPAFNAPFTAWTLLAAAFTCSAYSVAQLKGSKDFGVSYPRRRSGGEKNQTPEENPTVGHGRTHGGVQRSNP